MSHLPGSLSGFELGFRRVGTPSGIVPPAAATSAGLAKGETPSSAAAACR